MSKSKNILELAGEWKVGFTNPIKGNFLSMGADAGCPGIMDPVYDTPLIESTWIYGFANADKNFRGKEFIKVLNLLEIVKTSDQEMLNNFKDSLKDIYIQLSVYGRAMLVHIASLQEETLEVKILTTFAKYANSNLTDPYSGKHPNVSLETIYNKHVKSMENYNFGDTDNGSQNNLENSSVNTSKEEKIDVKEEVNSKDVIIEVKKEVKAEPILMSPEDTLDNFITNCYDTNSGLLSKNFIDVFSDKNALNPLRKALGLDELKYDPEYPDLELVDKILENKNCSEIFAEIGIEKFAMHAKSNLINKVIML